MKSCACPQITKQYDNISKKIYQSHMIRTRGRYTYKYSNSNTDNINQIIISQDYNKNKTLLFQLSLVGYRNYYAPLALQYRLSNVLLSILNDLTPEERDILYCNNEKPVIKPVPPVELEGITYYVVSRTVGAFTYFIFKNYTTEDFILPTYTYTFDLSDPSNETTQLSFSFSRSGLPLSSEYMDTTNPKLIKITLPRETNYTELYPFDASYNGNNPYIKYYKTGYTVGSFYIRTSAFSQQLTKSCAPVYNLVSLPNIYVMNDSTYKLYYLTASSMLYVYEFRGPTISIRDINSRESLQFLSNKKFAMSDISGNSRTYYIYVPQEYKLAILNTDQPNITYTGDADKKISDQVVVGTEADDLYDFYYGTIRVTIHGYFQPVSLYTLKYGYLHAKQLLVYAQNPDPTWDTNPYILPY